MCIDLKSFYASVECRERGLDPMTTNLVVADKSRTEKTICLAVSPSLKAYDIPGRARLFEVVQKVNEVNINRKYKAPNRMFTGSSYSSIDLDKNNDLKLDYIVAPPRMGLYMEYSTKIYNIYLKYIAPEDILVYSIDEVFCDITNYLKYYKCSPKELVSKIIKDVYETTGITATSGIGTNMYLAKVAMDIVAKHSEPNEIGVRIAELDEMNYRKLLWNHRPLTSFWRVGPGIAKKLEENGMYTMGDVARCSVKNEELLYKLFGINAELLIDHSWGWEPTTIDIAKSYKPVSNSLSSGQVLHCPYNYYQTKIIIQEMSELLSLDLVEKNVVTDQLVLTIGYDIDNLTNPDIKNKYFGPVVMDQYGRSIPKHSHGTINLDHKTSSSIAITKAFVELYDRIVNPMLLVRRVNLVANNIIRKDKVTDNDVKFEQFDLFTDYEALAKRKEEEKMKEEEENKLQHVILDIKKKYGKNGILKGMNLQKDGTTIDRNKQIGGHSA